MDVSIGSNPDLARGDAALLLCSDLDRLRIAVALTVLAKKPQKLSHSAYIFDLQREFSTAESCTDTASIANAWRIRALELEARLDDVQTLVDSERTELIALRLSVSSETSKSSGKASKKAQASIAPNFASEMPSLPPATWTPTLRAMLALVRGDVPNPPMQLVINTFSRTTHNIYELIAPSLASTFPDRSPAIQGSEALNLLVVILPQLLSSALSTIIHAHKSDGSPHAERDTSPYPAPTSTHRYPPVCTLWDAVDALLHPIQVHIIVPILSAMSTLARVRIDRLLVPRNEISSLPTAPLPPCALLPALNGLLRVLNSTSSIAKVGTRRIQVIQERMHALKDCAALHATQELIQLLDRAPDYMGDGIRNPVVRAARLARKEALHTLCTALYLFLEPSPQQSSHSVLHEQLCVALSELALKHPPLDNGAGIGRKRLGLSVVEQDALLSVLERAWMCGIRWDGEEGESDGNMGQAEC